MNNLPASFTLEDTAQQLKRPTSDITAAVPEVLNREVGVMFTVEDVEKLSTYFREKESSNKAESRGKQLTLKNRHQSTKQAANKNFQIEYRKVRGRKRNKPSPSEAPVKPKVEPVKVAASAAVLEPPKPPPSVDQAEIKEKHAEQDDMLDKISGLNVKSREQAKKDNGQAKEAVKAEDAQVAETIEKPPSKAAPKDGKDRSASKKGTLTVAAETVKHRKRKLERRRAAQEGPAKQEFTVPVHTKKFEVKVPEMISLRDLALAMSVKVDAVTEKLAEIVDSVDEIEQIEQDVAALIVEELGHKAIRVSAEKDSEYIASIKEAVGKEIVTRHPVVTIMGHVDHGKTSLLDYIRKTKVTETESGGITQHIGAYQVDTKGGTITFIDTPGHEVFTEMRARGANVTDIVVLVVAADDGVQPQTKEAIDHARAAKVPIVVALNKSDLEGADKDNVYRQLASEGLQPEDWGGETLVISVSAITGDGIDKLLEAISLTAELHEDDLKASLDRDAHGSIIEVKTEKGLGPVITAIVRQGVLRKGQFLLCDTAYGRVRALRDEDGKVVSEVGPSTPVQIQGISEPPKVGCEFFVADSEAKAREHAEERKHRLRQQELANQNVTFEADSLEEQFELLRRNEERKVLNVIVKADVAGTCEALEQSLGNIGNDDAQVTVIRSGVGAITDSDVTLAQASGAMLVGFRVSATGKTRKMINDRKVSAVFKDVFYEVTDHVKAVLEGMLVPIVEERVMGTAQVKEVFSIHKVGRIAGCGVTEGKIDASLPVRVVRDGAVIYKTKLSELRHHKDKVQSINAGSDCGIHLEKFSDFKPGDMIESFEEISTKQTL